MPQNRQQLASQAHRALLASEARALRSLRDVAARFQYIDPTEEGIRAAMAHLGEEFDHVLFQARMDARQASLHQVERELDISVIDAAAFTEEDRTRAHLVALSLSSAIGLAALILLRQGRRDPLRYAFALEDYRLRRVAATEVPNAYSRMHYEIEPGEGWARRWDATLDLRTCQICRRMHGVIVAIDELFPDGLVPGDVHPNCRCEPAYVPISMVKAA